MQNITVAPGNYGVRLNILNREIMPAAGLLAVSSRWKWSNGPPMRINSVSDCFQSGLFNGIEKSAAAPDVVISSRTPNDGIIEHEL